MSRILMILPPLVFAALAAMFWLGMQREDPDALPSTLVGRAAPVVQVGTLGDHPALLHEALTAPGVKLLNFWASWCAPCRAEHPVLMKMAAEGVRVAGINMMDRDADAQAYLAEAGNPFFALSTDPKGRNRIEWGVTNPPETFIIGKDGKVLFKFIGPLVGTDYERRFVPALAAALQP